jgi:sporadic carbohydrate cluster 2OG-Fe(II) oxygenase
MSREPWFRPAYYRLARGVLATLVGNELAMQRRINLSVQLPGDESSLLPVHSDVWSGDSAFEVVVWVPLVDCYRTKSMFILPRKLNDEHSKHLAGFRGKDTEELFQAIEPDVEWLTVSVGQGLIFTHTLMHGNRRNEEDEARWSMNCRFKSLLSPYDTKRLGEFFEPITLRAATRLGMTYTLPEGFER